MISVLFPGGQTLATDLGRPGHRHLGVPLGGAADRLSHQIANHLVGNAPEAGTLECALGGLSLTTDTDLAIAVTGASLDVTIDGRPQPQFQAHSLRAGQTLTLGAARSGMRAYVGLAGGVAATRHFGSLSTYPLAKLGANEGAPYRTGDKIEVGEPIGSPRTLPKAFLPRLSNHITLRVRSVGEYESLSAEAQRRLFVRPWQATRASDRMGSRLAGEGEDDILTLDDAPSLVSTPLLPGTLQVPPSGAPILALADAHCTGGYPRAVQAIAPDMWLTGQIAHGTRISFHRAFASEVPGILKAHLAHWRGVLPDYVL